MTVISQNKIEPQAEPKPLPIAEVAKLLDEPVDIQAELLRLLDSDPDAVVARFIDLGERGNVGLRFNVELPDDMYGEWVGDDPSSIQEAKNGGFKIDDKYAANKALHSDGSGIPKVGDAVFMTMPKRLYLAREAARANRFRRQHGVAQNLPEEVEFNNMITAAGLSTKYGGKDINESVQEGISGSSIYNSIKGMA
jgi:hypothetical protein